VLYFFGYSYFRTRSARPGFGLSGCVESERGRDGEKAKRRGKQETAKTRDRPAHKADSRLVAQVHPPDRDSALPPGASGAVEGQEPDLGHPGMYASFGYEDLDDLFPWIELKQSGTGGQSRRSGLGFD